jgi:hypothetical protein
MITLLICTEIGRKHIFLSLIIGSIIDLYLGYLLSKVLSLFL